jgi:hypothetical protein
MERRKVKNELVLFACVHNAGRSQMAAAARHLITMGCGDECPFVPGAETDDWPIEDPKGKPEVDSP